MYCGAVGVVAHVVSIISSWNFLASLAACTTAHAVDSINGLCQHFIYCPWRDSPALRFNHQTAFGENEKMPPDKETEILIGYILNGIEVSLTGNKPQSRKLYTFVKEVMFLKQTVELMTSA